MTFLRFKRKWLEITARTLNFQLFKSESVNRYIKIQYQCYNMENLFPGNRNVLCCTHFYYRHQLVHFKLLLFLVPMSCIIIIFCCILRSLWCQKIVIWRLDWSENFHIIENNNFVATLSTLSSLIAIYFNEAS